MMNRCVSEIIDKILTCIPSAEEQLRSEILTYKNSLWNKAPELLRTSECWAPLQITPLKIYNGTPDGRLNRDLRATLPINQLKGKPPQGTVAVCPILNVHRCILNKNIHEIDADWKNNVLRIYNDVA